MDNITPPSNEPEQARFLDRFPKWARPILALVGALIVLAIAIGIGGKYYYQVNPLTLPPTPTDQRPVDNTNAVAFDQALASAQPTPNSNQQCPYFLVDDPSHSLSTTTLAQMGQKLCTLFTEKGAAIIQHPLATGSSDYYGGEGSYSGIGIISSDR